MKHFKKNLNQALLWLMLGLIPQLAWAEVPNIVNYQGYLENTDGEPLNATVNMTFALYATAQEDSALWTETHQQIEVTNGVFSLILGSTTSFDNESLEGERYLGVTVDGDPEMTPRQQLTSAFFAMRAGVAESVKAATVETESIADGAVTAEKIAPQTITGDKIADLSGHNVTELDDVANAGSGKIISDAERQKLQGLGTGSSIFQLNGNNAYYTDGNVGIGTTTPSVSLDVHQDTSNEYTLRLFHTRDVGGNGILIESNGGDNDDTMLKIRGDLNGSPKDLFMVKGTGNVGIGTTSSGASLDVHQDTSNEYTLHLFHTQDVGGNGILIESNGGDNDDTMLKIRGDLNGSPKDLFIVKGTGNIGIGTTEPQAKLQVDGTIITQKLATKESQKEMIISVGGNNLFKISRTLSTHPAHEGVYERRLEFLGPDDNSKDLGKTSLYGGIALFGDKQHSSIGMGPSISFNSTFSNPSDNRHFFISLGDTSNNPGVSKNDVVFFSWNHLYKDHIQHLVLKANGNVGIGTINPQYKLDVAGTIRGNNVSPSDQRLKQNIQPLENSLAKVAQLRGVRFEWKDKAQDAGTQIGMIAQEVESVFPELVSTDSEGYKSLAYDKMTAVLIEAIKELKTQKDALKTIVDTLKTIVCEDHPEKVICQ
jgi:hypothetical protein